MSVQKIMLDTEKTTPIYEYPITLRQGDTSIQIPVEITDNFGTKDLTTTRLMFLSDKPDATTIEDDEQSHFKISADKKSFTYTFPDELTDASGSTSNTYFKIGSDSTSNFYIHILSKAGMEKIESGDYISKVDRIFNHVMSDYSAINDLSETAAATLKASLDKMNSDYTNFINSKNTEFKTYLATLDSQAADVKNKYAALKSQLDALEMPEIGGRNLIVRNGEIPDTIVGTDANINTFPGSSLMNSYIDVTPGEYLTFQVWGTYGKAGQAPDNNIRFAYYDDSNKLISRQLLSSYPTTLSVPNNAAKIQISYPTLMKVKVEAGNIPTDWTPAPEDKMDSNVQISTRNLLANTDRFDESTDVTNILKGKFNGNYVLRNSFTTDSKSQYGDIFNNATTVIADKEYYTLSFYAWADNDGDRIANFFTEPANVVSSVISEGTTNNSTDGATYFTLTKSPKLYWVTWKQTPTNVKKKVTIGRVNSSFGNKGPIYISLPMFVEGNQPMPHGPAPEDISVESSKIGIRNLISNSTSLLKGPKTVINLKDVISDKYNGNAIVKNPYTIIFPQNSYYDPVTFTTTIPLMADYYTASFYAWSDVEGDVMTNHLFSSDTTTLFGWNDQGEITNSSDGSIDTTLSKTPKKYWVTWKNGSNGKAKYLILGRVNKSSRKGHVNSGAVYVNSPMLVQGKKALDNVPAPEDYISQLSSVNKPQLTKNDNWDEYVNPGVYLVQSASGGNNIPTGAGDTWGYLMVLNGSPSGGAAQIYYNCVDTPVAIYMRGTRGTPLTWSPWIKLTTLDSLNGKTLKLKDSTGKEIAYTITGLS